MTGNTEALIIVKILKLLKELPTDRARRRVMTYLSDCDLFDMPQAEPPSETKA